MSKSNPPRQLWRSVCVFDGLSTLPEAMAVLVEGGVVAGLWPEHDFDPQQALGAVEVGRGGVLTPGLVDCHSQLPCRRRR